MHRGHTALPDGTSAPHSVQVVNDLSHAAAHP
jgi:hypothetical protein